MSQPPCGLGAVQQSRLLRLIQGLGILLVIGAVAGALRLAGSDEDLYGYIGYAWTHGDLPYRDAFENKPPGVFLVWALVWKLAGGSPFVGRSLGMLAVCGTALLLGKMAGGFWGSRWGALAGVLYVAAVSTRGFGYPYADTETFGVFFAVAGLALLWPSSRKLAWAAAAGAGACLGVAFLFKPVFGIEAAVGLVLLGLAVPSWRGRLGLAAILGLGFSVPLAAWGFYAHRAGILGDFLQVAFGQLGKITTTPVGRIKALYSAQGKVLQPITLTMVVLGATAAATAHSRGRPLTRLLVTWFWLVCAVLFVQGSFWTHQFKQLVAPLCLLAPGVMAALENAAGEPEFARSMQRLTGSALLLGLGASLFAVSEPTVMTAARRLRRGTEQADVPEARDGPAASRTPPPALAPPREESFASPKEAAARLTRPDERIWCYPGGSLYVEARRLSAARHFSPNFLFLPAAQEEVLAQLTAGRAALVMVNPAGDERVPESFVNRLRVVLARYFRRAGHAGEWEIYRFTAARGGRAGAGAGKNGR